MLEQQEKLDNSPIQHIAVVGADVIGWCAAVALARGLQGQNVKITVVDIAEKKQSLDQVIHASPHLFDFHKLFGIQDRQLLMSGQAKLISASQYFNFSQSLPDFFIGNDKLLPSFHSVELHQVLRWLTIDDNHSYSLSAQAAEKLLLALPTNNVGEISSSFSPSANLDAETYQWFMKGAATQLGVKLLTSPIEKVIYDEKSGFINELKLDNSELISADFILDNTGVDSVFKQLSDTRNYYDCSSYFPFDSKIHCSSEELGRAKPYQEFHANNHGWCEINFMPKYHTASLHYSSKTTSDDMAEKCLLTYLPKGHNFQKNKISPGYLKEFLQKNCLAIGNTAGYIGTSPFSQLIMMQRSISKLLELFPGKAFLPTNTAEINRRISSDYQEALNYSALMFTFLENTTVNEQNEKKPFAWQLAESHLPETLQQKIALFVSSGRVSNELNPFVSRDNWINLLRSKVKNVYGYEPILDALDKDNAEIYLDKIKKQISLCLTKYREYT